LPVAANFAFLDALRRGPLRNTPVVVLTADDRRSSLDRPERPGARLCRHKGSTLFDRVTRYLRTLGDLAPGPQGG